ncbi:MAG: hypothetical protein AAF828_07195 [Bacteroidota bacterium]
MKNIWRPSTCLFLIGVFSVSILRGQTCTCNDYLYLNERATNEIFKFRINDNGTVSEIGSPWFGDADMGVDDEFDSPHGVVIDPNGFVYIGNRPDAEPEDQGNIKRLSCNGDILIDDFIDDGSYNFATLDGLIYMNNFSFAGNDKIQIYDPCDGELVGEYNLPAGYNILGWGFHIDEDRRIFYVGSSFFGPGDGNIYTGSADPADYTLPATQTGSLFATIPFPSDNWAIMGITTDDAGNVYVATDNGNGFGSEAIIYKYNPAGALLNTVSDNTVNQSGFATLWGIVYSSQTGLLYASSRGDDCIAQIDPVTMTYAGPAVPFVPATDGKGLGIVTECCPESTPVTIMETVCASGANETTFPLHEFIACDGVVCESTAWTTVSPGTGFEYNDCDNSVTVSPRASGCATYNLSSDGTGANAQCTAGFNITVEICVEIPNGNVTTIPATCSGTSVNNDAQIVLEDIVDADVVGISSAGAATYNGSNYNATAAAGDLMAVSGANTATFSNLPQGTSYILRVFNGSNDCFTDIPVTTVATFCTEFACACTEYIYLNEPGAGSIHKLEVVPGQVGLSELQNEGNYWYPGTATSELPSPHGIVTDLNGFLYVGETGSDGSLIRRLDCDATISPTTEFTLGPNTGIKQNYFTIGNLLYSNSGGGPTVWDLCEQDVAYQGCLQDAAGNPMPPGANNWGLSYNETTNTIYASSRLLQTENDGSGATVFRASTIPVERRSLIWTFTPEEYEAAAMGGTCIAPLLTEGNTATLTAGDMFTPNDDGSLLGIAGDNSGDFYVLKGRLENDNGTSGAKILKYSAAGAFIRESPADMTANDGGYHAAIGLIISERNNKVYLSTLSSAPLDDCVSRFDATTLAYEGTAFPNPPSGGQGAKGISIITECCPGVASQMINLTACGTEVVGQDIFLADLYNCGEGVICEGTWSVRTPAGNQVYDSCDDSITILPGTGCGTYVFSKGQREGVQRCPAFEVVVEYCVLQADCGTFPWEGRR